MRLLRTRDGELLRPLRGGVDPEQQRKAAMYEPIAQSARPGFPSSSFDMPGTGTHHLRPN